MVCKNLRRDQFFPQLDCNEIHILLGLPFGAPVYLLFF
jgi:hypothetical protein